MSPPPATPMMMMMMSRFVERVLNSPRARCQSAEQVYMSTTQIPRAIQKLGSEKLKATRLPVTNIEMHENLR